ncbi:hypothetical protein AB205_0204680 [Aquarana catesbeiana]|uniref:Uncharacterized protein n=1 Tax=Aquarana catesbeiana TaxID=8400 RepID=A0A2G9RV70_AQUCT|nr:hypothetical protein AB205_0204680 [Aquarana catesbeiana]
MVVAGEWLVVGIQWCVPNVASLKDRRQSASAVPSASMTRLARSRTASLTSASSVDGGRPRPCTQSESSEGIGQINHTMEVSC